MVALKLRSVSLLAALLPLCACQPPDVHTAIEGPELVLTAEANDVQYGLQFCYSGPILEEAHFGGTVTAEVSGAQAAQGLELTVELPGVDAPEIEPERYRDTVTVGDERGLWLEFPREEGVFENKSSACSEVYLLSFSLEGELYEGQEITVDWYADFGGRYSASGRENPRHDQLSIILEAL